MRPIIDLVVPVQHESRELDNAVRSIERTTEHYNLIVLKKPGLNVAEARQKAMKEVVKSRYVCFLDDDSEFVRSGWLEAMYEVLQERADAGAVFSREWWGTEPEPKSGEGASVEVAYGPAACMLLDLERIPDAVVWDGNLGLKNGWLGGDFEEVDYCKRLIHAGLKCYRAENSVFRHKGSKTTRRAFGRSDRIKAITAIRLLLNYKYAKAPGDDDWFKGLQYVKADPNDDNMLAPGASLRDCYKDVIRRNGLRHVPGFKRMGLV